MTTATLHIGDPQARAAARAVLANYIRVGPEFTAGKLTGRVPFDIYVAG